MRRLGVSLILLVLASLIALGWLGDRLFGADSSTDNSPVQTVREIGALLAEQLGQNDSGLFNQKTLEDVMADGKGYSIQWVGVDEMSLPDMLEEELNKNGTITLETDQQVIVYHQVKGTANDITHLLALSVPQVKPQQISLKLGLTLLFYAALAGLLMLWLYPLMSRINKLTGVANAVGQGDFSKKINTSPTSSLYTIETEFNRMSQRIQSLLEDNRLLSGAVSHDLRTPLARLRFGIDALQEQEHNEVSRGYLQRINQDLDAMEQLVGVLLEFVKLDKQLDELPLDKVLLNDLLADCVSTFDIPDTLKIDAELSSSNRHVKGEDTFTRMLVNNLLGNAIKHANANVRVSLEESRDSLWLIVEDDGPGFGDNDPARLLKPFERGLGHTVNEQRKGYGLGLAIVNRIVDWYGSELLLQSSDFLGGARVSVGFKWAD